MIRRGFYTVWGSASGLGLALGLIEDWPDIAIFALAVSWTLRWAADPSDRGW